MPRKHHAWARFDAGAWKTCKAVTETLNEQGEVVTVSTTTTTTTMDRVRRSNYTLRIEATVEVQGRKIVGPPQTISYGLFGETDGETTSVKDAGEESVTIEGVDYPCQVWIVESVNDEQRRVAKFYYNPDRSPYVLRCETTSTAAGSDTPSVQTVEETLAVDMPFKLPGNIVSTSHVRTVRTTPKGQTITIAVQSDDIPGGIVAHATKELDENGRIIRRSTLELVDYGLKRERRSQRRRRARLNTQDEELESDDGLSKTENPPGAFRR